MGQISQKIPVAFLITTRGGLANRLRTVAGFYFVAKCVKRPLYVQWLPDDACPAFFSALFQPIDNVHFVSGKKDCDAVLFTDEIFKFAGQTTIRAILQDFESFLLPKKPIDELEQSALEFYAQLTPIENLINIIEKQKPSFDIDVVYGLHVRRTDHIELAINRVGSYTTDEEFFSIIDRHLLESPTAKFYLSTDNGGTQKTFRARYGQKVVFWYKDIDCEPICDVKKNNLRHTSVEHAVIDLFLLAQCKSIYGSTWSSFSTCAKRISFAQKNKK